MPNVPNTLSDGYIHSIREKGSPVKPKMQNVTESQQFKRWFGDWQQHSDKASKIVKFPRFARKLFVMIILLLRNNPLYCSNLMFIKK